LWVLSVNECNRDVTPTSQNGGPNHVECGLYVL